MSPEAQQDVVEGQPSRGTFAPAYAEGSNKSQAGVRAFKFGGTSLLGAARMLHAAALVRDAAAKGDVVVVVSAMKGVTDRLLAIVRTLEAGCRSDARRDAEHILRLHLDVVRDFQLERPETDRVAHELHLLGRDLLHDASPETRPSPVERAALQDRLASYGERFSARLFAAALEKSGVPAIPVSSSEFVLTCDTFRDARPQIEETRRRGREILLPLFEDGLVPVVTGFIGTTRDGRVTTLGRNSSDFSGALIAHVLDADELVIWTDVDGIYTANPRESEEAKLLHELSYDEAHALASAGAKVLHAKVLPLAAETEMVVWVRNTFNPQVRGTRIGPNVAPDSSVPASRGCHNPNSRGAA
jgi:bifunctional aspartokinase / homoserine dehydrogenase 1